MNDELKVKAAKDSSPDAGLSESSNNNGEESQPTCPLFMEGLPTDFKTNPVLSALVSLFDDSENEENSSFKRTRTANDATARNNIKGGKTYRNSQLQRERRKDYPYEHPSNRRNGRSKNPSAAVSEAQLFLTMWKLN
mmetsp:Transcript_30548/g.46589  ORF Transcript_30548/g.46589 Transcript_30548/m.46589 type:complete len:137 (-) Transcript_30548:34-444(-)